jgi:serine/threonine protein phosphatase PrpC
VSAVATLEFVTLTDVGCVRERNEDYFGEFLAGNGDRLLVVCDGMGGHRGGATASREAVAAIGSVFSASDEPPEILLRHAFTLANGQVFAHSQEDPELRGMGTTGVGLWVGADGRGFVVHVGDSRAYRVRNGVIEQITDDHSLVGEMMRRGLLTAEEAAVHPQKNEILRCLGVQPEVEVDVNPLELRGGDCYVLCSDGLTDVVTDPEIAEVLAAMGPLEAARRLIDMALERGGPDNVTVQIARLAGDVASLDDDTPTSPLRVSDVTPTAPIEVSEASAAYQVPDDAETLPIEVRHDRSPGGSDSRSASRGAGRRLLPVLLAGVIGLAVAAGIAFQVVRGDADAGMARTSALDQDTAALPRDTGGPSAAFAPEDAPVWIPVADVDDGAD